MSSRGLAPATSSWARRWPFAQTSSLRKGWLSCRCCPSLWRPLSPERAPTAVGPHPAMRPRPPVQRLSHLLTCPSSLRPPNFHFHQSLCNSVPPFPSSEAKRLIGIEAGRPWCAPTSLLCSSALPFTARQSRKTHQAPLPRVSRLTHLPLPSVPTEQVAHLPGALRRACRCRESRPGVPGSRARRGRKPGHRGTDVHNTFCASRHHC